jgi:hypothetical protein
MAPLGAPHVESVRERRTASPNANGATAASVPQCVIEHMGTEAIFAPLPAIAWLCEGLYLSPGGVACFAGYGYSGKTIVAQSIALSVATGRNVFGVFPCKQGRVLHLDYEQGARLTRERYQRLARGIGATREAFGDRLCLAVYPSTYLDAPSAAEALARTIEGFDLVIVDSLRAAAPSLEENSSLMRGPIDLLARAGERAGALPLLLHHARKPNDDARGGAKMSIRGSGAIFDGCTEVYVLGASKGEPVRVEHEKERLYGRELADFGLRIEDVEGAHGLDRSIDPRWGLRVVHLDRAQLDARPSGAGGALLAKHAERIVAFLASRGGTFTGNKGALIDAIGMQRTAFFAAFSTLEGSERVRVDTSKRTGPRISLIPEVKP